MTQFEEWPDTLKLLNDNMDEISNYMQAHPNNKPDEYTVFVKQTNDGRPMATDKFLVELFEACDDHYDREEAIKLWLDGVWDEALEYLNEED